MTVCSDLLSELPTNHERPDVSTFVQRSFWKADKLAVLCPGRTEEHVHSPKSRNIHQVYSKTHITYPTNSPSAAAPSLPYPHHPPSLFPFPSHPYSNRQRTKASTGGGGTKRSSSPASKQSCGGMGSRKTMTRPLGGRARIVCRGCGL